MDRVVVVVTRWFGGIKLGAGGLVRAYGGTAAECLRRAGRVALVDMRELALHPPLEDLGTVLAALAAASAEKISETFATAVPLLLLRLRAHVAAPLIMHLRQAVRQRVRLTVNEWWVAFDWKLLGLGQRCTVT